MAKRLEGEASEEALAGSIRRSEGATGATLVG